MTLFSVQGCRSGTTDKELLKLVRHVAVAGRVWLTRLQGKGAAQYSLWEETQNLTARLTDCCSNSEARRIE